MKSDKLFDAIGDISDDMLIPALVTPRKTSRMKFTIIAAACLCIVLLAVPLALMLMQKSGDLDFGTKSDNMGNSCHDGLPTQSALDSEKPDIPTESLRPPEQGGAEDDNSNDPSGSVSDGGTIYTEFTGNILTIESNGNSLSYTEAKTDDCSEYTKGAYIADVAWNGNMWKIYGTKEHSDRSVLILISEPGEAKVFKSK